MTAPDRWRIEESAADWECGWRDAERFQMRYFAALSMQEKLQAVAPSTLGQASRIPGVTPAAISILAVLLRQRRAP